MYDVSNSICMALRFGRGRRARRAADDALVDGIGTLANSSHAAGHGQGAERMSLVTEDGAADEDDGAPGAAAGTDTPSCDPLPRFPSTRMRRALSAASVILGGFCRAVLPHLPRQQHWCRRAHRKRPRA